MDLSVLKGATYRNVMVGGLFFRLGTAALPFLCSISLQVRHGMSPQATGAILTVAAIGSILSKPLASSVLSRLGFRSALVKNTILSALLLPGIAGLLALDQVASGILALVLGMTGFVRSLQFTALNSLNYPSI